jgi:hypothetical protein
MVGWDGFTTLRLCTSIKSGIKWSPAWAIETLSAVLPSYTGGTLARSSCRLASSRTTEEIGQSHKSDTQRALATALQKLPCDA